MNLLNKHNGHHGSEDQMQQEIAEIFEKKEFAVGSRYDLELKTPQVYREITIPEIGRRSDVIVKVTARKVFNIECKIVDAGGVLRQAIDHLQWADYSFICLHDTAYIPTYIIREMTQHGIGLLIWKKGSLTEAFGADYNKRKNKKLREKMNKILNQRDQIIIAEKQTQKLF